MTLKVYEYSGCGTCKKALKFLDSKNVEYKAIAIRETPPTVSELKKMLKYMDGNLRKLFNTSGQDYRKLELKDKLPKMSEQKAIELLSKNGNLVKRPFILDSKWGTVGFKEEEWKKVF